MAISFLNNEPALLIKEEKLLVVGDLHIGLEFRFSEQGIHFTGASKKMGQNLNKIYKKSGAKGIVLLGDIKESITYPASDEYIALRSFFEQLNGIEIKIVRGNHDAYLDKVLRNFGMEMELKNELILSKTSLIHGNTMPSDEAMKKSYIIAGHGHAAVQINEMDEKAWIIAKPGKEISKKYPKYNKNVKLVVMPTFSDLITGKRFDPNSSSNMPIFRREIFDWKGSEIHDLRGNIIRKLH